MTRDARMELAFGAGVLVLLALACGGGGGGGGGGSGGGSSSTLQGNVSSASTAAVIHERRSWLARLGRELDGSVRQAFAASNVGGVQVRASGASTSGVTDVTDDTGAFALAGAPTGNVTVVFSRDRCQGEVILPDVAVGSVLTMEDVTFDCTGAEPAKVSETFSGVTHNVPSSREGSLTVCISTGSAARLRVVRVQNAVIRDSNGTPTNFSNLAPGQLVETLGDRQELGSSSVVAASSVKILGTASDDCSEESTPAPSPTETPTSEATPTATPAP